MLTQIYIIIIIFKIQKLISRNGTEYSRMKSWICVRAHLPQGGGSYSINNRRTLYYDACHDESRDDYDTLPRAPYHDVVEFNGSGYIYIYIYPLPLNLIWSEI